MAFKKNTFKKSVSENPAIHFKTLTKRQIPDVMPHQKEMLEAYASDFQASPDAALQLPTGSGKTLVGLLIADWRRLQDGFRSVYLCPTRQLVHQTVSQARGLYGIDVVDLSGPKDKFAAADRAAFMTGAAVAISTYSGLFNTNPFFRDPNLIVIDDAHAAENYIAKMWSLDIDFGTPLHSALAEFLRPHLDPQEHSRLTGDWTDPSDTNWVEKLPSPFVATIEKELIEIIDAHATRHSNNLRFPWSLIRDHLAACHIYLSSNSILIRPLIPPTHSHAPFANADQRIFMSATLGAGGDLERLTGRQEIQRLSAPEGFQSAGVGRRFFMFPSLSLQDEDVDTLRLKIQEIAGRSLVLTPTTSQAEEHIERVQNSLEQFTVFRKDDIETDKEPFIESNNAVAILANRYDGIDFPNDECRLLCLDGLPRAMNAQERFIMSKMGASALFNERIQTRVLQAAGRCTRALQDRSAVFITGTELVDFLADSRNWEYFHPELQAELDFGVDQSTGVTPDEMLDNFSMFMENSSEWADADQMIRTGMGTKNQSDFPAMDELAGVVNYEIDFQVALWNHDFDAALRSARAILGVLTHESLRGYRALWQYLAGAVAHKLSKEAGDGYAQAAQEHFANARKAAPSISWLNTLARFTGGLRNEEDIEINAEHPEIVRQVENLEHQFVSMGITTNTGFERKVASVLEKMDDPSTFEEAQVLLGQLLGFASGNTESDGAPDPWWLGSGIGCVFEDHANAKETTVFGASKARQAAGHPKWIKQNIAGTENMEILPILITPCRTTHSGAVPHFEGVRYWYLEDYRNWVVRAIGTLRDLKAGFPREGDLLWRAEARTRITREGLSLLSILDALPMAGDAMRVVD